MSKYQASLVVIDTNSINKTAVYYALILVQLSEGEKKGTPKQCPIK